MSLQVFTHPAGIAHDPGPGHPEAPIRLQVILAAIRKAELPGMTFKEAPKASREQLERAHPAPYVDRIEASIPATGWARLDADTVACPDSGEAASRAAGAACAAVDAVIAGETRRAFCAMRPPGHHAEPMQAMGFCLFNSIAVGALQARHVHRLSRIAIVDFDVHHGNGTQAMFRDDPDTLFISSHQSPLYPGTGAAHERGVKHNILNRPLPPGANGTMFRRTYEAELLPVLDRFAPELLMISAGFDAHRADPLAQLELEEDDFAWVTGELVKIADAHAGGRVVSVLEGGYDPPALARSVVAHLHALAGGPS